jgi:bacteriorhodopsin
MLVGALISLLGVPSFYTVLGLGWTRVIASGQFLSTGVNAAVVIAWASYTGRLEPTSIGFAVILATCATTAYYSWANAGILVALERGGRPAAHASR